MVKDPTWDILKFRSMENGEQCVMRNGIMLMPRLCVSSLDTLEL